MTTTDIIFGLALGIASATATALAIIAYPVVAQARAILRQRAR